MIKNNRIKKALIFVMMFSLLIPNLAIATGDFFPDVKDDYWAQETIEYFYNNGIVHGYPDGEFKPERNISHGEGLKITVLASKMEAAFKDSGYEIRKVNPVDQAGHWSEKYIEAAHDNGIMVDLKNGLEYDKKLTRYEAVRYMTLYLDNMYPKIEVPLDVILGEQDGSTFIDAYGDGLEFLFEEEIIRGYKEDGKTYFYGDREITRAEFLALLKRVVTYEFIPEAPPEPEPEPEKPSRPRPAPSPEPAPAPAPEPTPTPEPEIVTDPIFYAVTFVDWNDSILDEQELQEGMDATAPADPIRDGYMFTGWDTDFTNIQSDLTVTALYEKIIEDEKNKYEVTFIDWDDWELKTMEVNHGEDAMAPADPMRWEYVFTGWDTDFTNVTSDLLVQAIYKKAIFTCSLPNEYNLVITDDGVVKGRVNYPTDIVIPEEILTYSGVCVPVTKIDSRAFYDQNHLSDELKLQSVVIPNTITHIGHEAFGKQHLTSVVIPDSVVELGYGAFIENKLTQAIIGSGLEIIEERTFKDNNLTSIIIPKSVFEIREESFLDNSLIELAMGNSVTLIGRSAFDGNSISSMNLSTSVEIIERRAFYDNQLSEVNFPETLITIGDYAFAENNITEVIIPDSTTLIDGGAFYNNGTTLLSLGNSVEIIGQSAFHSNKLTSVIIPDSVITIDQYAFRVNEINYLDLGNSVEIIGAQAFRLNSDIDSIIIPDSTTGIGTGAFQNLNINTLALGNSVETINSSAFAGNSLTELTIPDSVVTIGNSAFLSNNISLLTLGNSVETIGRAAFSSMNIESLIIPDSMISIDNAAFYSNNITDLDLGNGVQTIGRDAFSGNNFSSLTVPASAIGIDSFAFGVEGPSSPGTWTKIEGTWINSTEPEVPTEPETALYTVEFYDWDSTLLGTQEVEEGMFVMPPSAPIRDGYIFTGWDTNLFNVITDLTITAIYEEVVVVPEVTEVATFSAITVTAGDEITLPNMVEITYSDETTDMVGITWNDGEFDLTVPGEYTLTGTIEETELTASIVIIVEELIIEEPVQP